MQSKLLDAMPALLLAIYILIANVATGLQYGFSAQPSASSNLVYTLGFFWGLNWWFINDSQKYEWKWVFSWGNLVFLAGWILVPLYLFKTRGARAFLILFLFIGLYFGAYITGIVSGAILSALLQP
jgi:hypothetical protein